MHVVYIASFENLRTKEGHFLWPRFRETSDAVFLAKISWRGPTPIPADHQKDTLPIFRSLMLDAFQKSYLEFREPESFGQLDQSKIQEADSELQSLYNQLMQPDRGYVFSVNPPEGMTPDEKKFYRDRGF